MKTLDLNQMEKLQGGTVPCRTRSTTTDVIGTLFAGVFYWIVVAFCD